MAKVETSRTDVKVHKIHFTFADIRNLLMEKISDETGLSIDEIRLSLVAARQHETHVRTQFKYGEETTGSPSYTTGVWASLTVTEDLILQRELTERDTDGDA